MHLPTEKKTVFALAALLLISNMASAEFLLRSISVFMNINQDGSVNVEEKLAIMMNGSSRELYEETRAAYSDLGTWKNRTELAEMRHHVSRASADIYNLRVIPQAIDRCNPYMGLCHATVVLDYTVRASSKNGSGLVSVDWFKPRTAKYSIQQSALSFEQTKTGDLLLPPNTNISLAIPAAAEKIYFSAPPENLQGDETQFRYDQSANVRYYIGNARVFNWQGDTLSKFQFTYEIEFPLETEVMGFFKDAQNSVIMLFLGPEGIAALILIGASAASIYYFNRLGK
jgi:hypothetical protein